MRNSLPYTVSKNINGTGLEINQGFNMNYELFSNDFLTYLSYLSFLNISDQF